MITAVVVGTAVAGSSYITAIPLLGLWIRCLATVGGQEGGFVVVEVFASSSCHCL